MTDYSGLYVTVGPPGCGKTHWLAVQVAACLERGARVLLCSLTKTAAHEIAARARRHGLDVEPESIGTLHSHAYRAIGRPTVAEGDLDSWNEHAPHWAIGAEKRFDPDDPYAPSQSSCGDGEDLMQRHQLLRARRVDPRMWPASVQAFAARWRAWKDVHGHVDFTDMIEIAMEVPPPGSPDVILADEAQDLSALEHDLLTTWGPRAGALIIVGDPRQALYTWRGAHPEMFDADVPDGHRHLLSYSHRIPRAVHALATRWATRLSDWKHVEFSPRCRDGEGSEPVEGGVEAVDVQWQNPGRLVSLLGSPTNGRTTMVAASCGYMLNPTLAMLREAGVPFSNPWRRRRGDWNPLGPRRGTSLADRVSAFLRTVAQGESWSVGALAVWAPLLRAAGVLARGAKTRLAERGRRGRIGPYDLDAWFDGAMIPFVLRAFSGEVDQGEASRWLVEHATEKYRRALPYPLRVASRHGIEALHDEPRVYVGTVHSFKGGEADDVLLWPDLSPQGMREWLGQPTERDNVVRTMYVGATRARERLMVGAPSSGLACDLWQEV